MRLYFITSGNQACVLDDNDPEVKSITSPYRNGLSMTPIAILKPLILRKLGVSSHEILLAEGEGAIPIVDQTPNSLKKFFSGDFIPIITNPIPAAASAASALPAMTRREEFEKRIHESAGEFFRPVASIAASWEEKSQVLWKASCREAANQALKKIESKEQPTLLELYDFLADQRKEIARELRHDRRRGFGEKWDLNMTAYNLPHELICIKSDVPGVMDVPSPYLSQTSFLKEKIEHSLRLDNPNCSAYICRGTSALAADYLPEYRQFCDYLTKENYEVKDLAIYGEGLDEKDQQIRIQYSRVSHVKTEKKEYFITSHLHPSHIPAAFRYADRIYQKILETSDSYEAVKYIGLLTWHLYNIMPLQGGSSSVAMMVESALLQLHYIVPMRSSDAISWDFRAFASLPEDYVKHFIAKTKPEFTERFAHEIDSKADSKEMREPKKIELFDDNPLLSLRMTGSIHNIRDMHLLPLSLHSKSCSNPFRTLDEITLISNVGQEYFEKQREKKRIEMLAWADRGRYLSPEKREFFEERDAFFAMMAVYYKFFTPYDHFFEKINNISLEELKEIRKQYQKTRLLFDILDAMPYKIRGIFISHLLEMSPEKSVASSETTTFTRSVSKKAFQSGILSAKQILFMETILRLLPDIIRVLKNTDPLTTLYSQEKATSVTEEEKTENRELIRQLHTLIEADAPTEPVAGTAATFFSSESKIPMRTADSATPTITKKT